MRTTHHGRDKREAGGAKAAVRDCGRRPGTFEYPMPSGDEPILGLAAKGRCSSAMTQRLLRSSVLTTLRGSRRPADLAGGSFHNAPLRGGERHNKKR
jgi:hypothetical protein